MFLTEPRKPYCATTGSGCSQWEIDNYKRGVESYFNSLKDYLAAVDKYRKQAYEYAECMSKFD